MIVFFIIIILQNIHVVNEGYDIEYLSMKTLFYNHVFCCVCQTTSRAPDEEEEQIEEEEELGVAETYADYMPSKGKY